MNIKPWRIWSASTAKILLINPKLAHRTTATTAAPNSVNLIPKRFIILSPKTRKIISLAEPINTANPRMVLSAPMFFIVNRKESIIKTHGSMNNKCKSHKQHKFAVFENF